MNSTSAEGNGAEESIILISDGDDDDNDVDTTLDPSVLVIECTDDDSDEKQPSEEIVDEEFGLAITFSKKADVMPHARYDCPENPFERTECDTSFPLEKNANFCEQCFCYICDKQAFKCQYWTTTSICHCNAHNKSKYWKAQWDAALAGVLTVFNFELTEIDTDLRHGGDLLLQFIGELSVEYSRYLQGVVINYNDLVPCQCVCHKNSRRGHNCNYCKQHHIHVIIYRYSHVYNLITQFLNRAEEENPKAAAIMLLGTAKEILLHKEPIHCLINEQNKSESLRPLVQLLMHRITVSLQRKLVLCDFPEFLFKKLILFFQSLPLPPYCFSFCNCLNVLPWDDLLLTSVLKGQNVTGQRKNKGKKENLWESIAVIEARIQRMEEKKEYRELVRYLRVIKATDSLKLRDFRDRIPYYLCLIGEFKSAAESIFAFSNLACCTACRMTADEFCLFLKMARTGSILTEKGEWTVVKGAEPLKKCMLLKCAIRILYRNKLCHKSSECWAYIIQIMCITSVLGPQGQLVSTTFSEPVAKFQETVIAASVLLLNDLKTKPNVVFPQPFQSVLCNVADLILATQAVINMLLKDIQHLNSILPIILAFGRNMWALKILINGIGWKEDVLSQFTSLLVNDLCEQENNQFKLLLSVDADHVCDLLVLFLTHCHMSVRSVGMQLFNLIVKNWNNLSKLFPWMKSLNMLLQNKVVTAVADIASPQFVELKNKIQAALGKV